MSLSRFAALGVALLAGVTLASCASSASFVAASGPNTQTFSTNNARVRFVQGSPNINLGMSIADLYIDNKFAGTFPYGVIGPWIYSLSAGTHNFQLKQFGTQFPLFAAANFTLVAGTKYAVVMQGDAAVHSTSLNLIVEPKYNTPSGAFATSFFNASPRNPGSSMTYNCLTGGPACANGIGANSILFHSVNDGWCFAAYTSGSVLIASASLPAGQNPRFAQCSAIFLVPTITAPTNNMDIFLVDDIASPSSILLIRPIESNG